MSKKANLFLSFIMVSSLMLCAIAEGAQQYTLTVVNQGSGGGTVTSSPAGINCGSECSELYDQGTKITLKVKADPGSTFKGWSGGCTGTKPSCKLTMNSDQTVTATFALPDLRGELSDISVKVNKSIYEVSGKLTVYSDEAKAAGVKASVYLSHDETYYQDGDLLGLMTIGTINAGSSKSKSFKYKGTYNPSGRYVLAVIDPDSAIRESNEANNIAVSYYRGEAPQLEVTADGASRVSGVSDHGEGGTLETISGVSDLSLTILPYSFNSSTEISLTGVSEIGGLPEEITMLTGAQLGSGGLRLIKPATLTIGLPPGAPSKGLIGFISQDNGRRFQFYPIEVNGSTVTFEMTHFTSVGVGEISCTGTWWDLIKTSILGNPSWLSGEALAEHRLAMAYARWVCGIYDVSSFLDDVRDILIYWYFGEGGKRGLMDRITNPPKDPDAFLVTVAEYLHWSWIVEQDDFTSRRYFRQPEPRDCGDPSGRQCYSLEDVRQAGKAAIIEAIKKGIIDANKACLASGDPPQDAIILKWLWIAEFLRFVYPEINMNELWDLKTCGVYSLEVSPAQATIDVGDKVPLQAIVKDKAGKVLSGYKTNWSSKDEAIAVVPKLSGKNIELVTGVSQGTTKVECHLQQNYFLSAQSDITVIPPVVAVVVTADFQYIQRGDTMQLTAAVTDASGISKGGLYSVRWSSSDTAVATVSQTGLLTTVLTAVGKGTATLTATVMGVSGSISLTVVPRLFTIYNAAIAGTCTCVYCDCNAPHIIPCEIQMELYAVDEKDHCLYLVPPCTWSLEPGSNLWGSCGGNSTNPVQISSTGLVTVVQEHGCAWAMAACPIKAFGSDTAAVGFLQQFLVNYTYEDCLYLWPGFQDMPPATCTAPPHP